MSMIHRTFIIKFGTLAFAMIALASCRPEEQGRPLHYEQGVYQGKPDTEKLSEKDLAHLRERALRQGGDTTNSVQGDLSGASGSDVRLPVSPAQ